MSAAAAAVPSETIDGRWLTMIVSSQPEPLFGGEACVQVPAPSPVGANAPGAVGVALP